MTAKLTFAGLLFLSAAAWAQPPAAPPVGEETPTKARREAARERLKEQREQKAGKADADVPAAKVGRALPGADTPVASPPGIGASTPPSAGPATISTPTPRSADAPPIDAPAAATPSTLPADAARPGRSEPLPRGGLRQAGAGRAREAVPTETNATPSVAKVPADPGAAEESTDLSPTPNATPAQGPGRGRLRQNQVPRPGQTPAAAVITPEAVGSTPAVGAPTSTPRRTVPTGAPDSAAPSAPGSAAPTAAPATSTGTTVDTPVAGGTPRAGGARRPDRSTPAADATPFVPAEMPAHLQDTKAEPGAATPRGETDQQQRARELRERLRNRREGTDKTPGATRTPRGAAPADDTPTAGGTPAAPGGTPAAPGGTPAAPGAPGGTPGSPGGTPAAPGASPSPGGPGATPAAPGGTPGGPGATPAAPSASPAPGGPGATPAAPGITPAAPGATPAAPGAPPEPGVSPGPGATPGADAGAGPRRGRGGRFEGKAQPQPKLTPYAPRKAREVPTGTPTPTPRPSPIAASDAAPPPGLTATPPPAPTPGATPVPTPPGATPTPTSWAPPREWSPYPGWSPPEGWKPPTGWTPPGGWSPPPGWEPPREWSEKLIKWGWKYVPTRGWVVDVRWTPPPDFVVPPGWYYLPTDAYDDYGLYYPGRVVIRPGAMRRDLIVTINRDQVYMPPPPPSSELIEIVQPPPRPMPAAPPVEVQTVTVETVREVLTRERQPDSQRYDGPVLVTGAIHFDYDSYAIKPESFDALDKVGEALISPPLDQSIINVEGHTDADGSDEYNQKLSEQRAWSVKSYLVQKFGIDPNRLIIVGYGERAAIADNQSDEGKAHNRRVEFENVTDLYEAQVVQQ